MREINVLISHYLLCKMKPIRFAGMIRIMQATNMIIDSGAFTIWNRQRRGLPDEGITLDQYIMYCQLYYKDAYDYVMFDEIGDRQGTITNMAKMRAAGLDPMGVLTYNAPIDDVHELISKRDNRISVNGGAMPIHTRKRMGGETWYPKRIQDIKAAIPWSSIHALGYSSFQGTYNVFTLPISSFDSSSHRMGQKMGRVFWWDRRRGLSAMTFGRNVATTDNDRIVSFGEFANKCGVSLEDVLNTRQTQGWSFFGISSTAAHLEAMRQAELRGRKYFLVIQGIDECLSMYAALKNRIPGGYGAFNYKDALADRRAMSELAKKDYPKAIEGMARVFQNGFN